MKSMKTLLTIIALMTLNHPSKILGGDNADQLPDIRIGSFNVEITNGDWQNLTIDGNGIIEVINYSYHNINNNYNIVIFDDINSNDIFDAETDTVMGRSRISCCHRWSSGIFKVNISGIVRFRDAILSVMVDSESEISEINEQNNYSESNPNCTYIWNPLDNKISTGRESWRWIGGAERTSSRRVQTSPIIVDLDGDKTSDIIFSSHDHRDIIDVNGPLRVISGGDGRDVFASTTDIESTSSIAVADIDRDGRTEIITIGRRGSGEGKYRVIIFDNLGNIKIESDYIDERVSWGGASIADIGGDGIGEIIVCATAISHLGRVLWRGSAGRGQVSSGCHSTVADIDMDGKIDILAGNTLYGGDGRVLWNRDDLPDGLTAIGNFDSDILPEIVLVTDKSDIYLLNSDGTTVWGGIDIPGEANNLKGGGMPTIADVDGDGMAEIGVSNNAAYTVFKDNGSILWSKATVDPGGRSAASAFDFNADGRYELIYGDEQHLRIFNGRNGDIIWETKRPAGTGFDLPTVADVDGNNVVEIFSGFSSGYTSEESVANPPGVYSFIPGGARWAWTRSIWNQMSYHVNNIDDAGIVPIFEYPSWIDHNTFRAAVVDAYRSGAGDVTLSRIFVKKAENSLDWEVYVRAGNGGGLTVAPGVSVAVFDGDPASGGKLIGKTTTRSKIRYNQFIDIPQSGDVQITWPNPSLGRHRLYAVADYSDILTECRIQNNIHYVDVDISTNTPDTGATGTTTAPVPSAITPGVEITPTIPKPAETPSTSWEGPSYIPFLWRWRR